jgi:hypothetical protein
MEAMLVLVAGLALVLQDADTDGDGLSDIHERGKYLTDPAKAVSDGDGTPDGDWHERREYAYTVRAVLQVMPPCNLREMNDDFQDARVLEERADAIEVEVVLYPLATVHADIAARREWRKADPALEPYLRPGSTANWDAAMRDELLAELKKESIELDALTDREAVERISAWLMKRSAFEEGFTTFAVEFKEGKPCVAAGHEESVARELAKTKRTIEAQWERELFGAGMFRNRVHGACTSTSIYLTSGLRAAGIPTRTVICIPVIDASDPREVALASRLQHHRVRSAVEHAAGVNGASWASHTFNEVFVGGRWRRLNYAKLGQGILDREYLGLMVHVNTFGDLAEAGLAATWGLRAAKGTRDDVFGHSNPYSCLSLSDRFGAHAKVENPPAEGEFAALTVGRAYWYDDPTKNAIVTMRLDDAETAGHLLLHVDEGKDGEGTAAYAAFYRRVGKGFVLRAKGQADVRAAAERGYWVAAGGVREFYVRIPPSEFAKMARGVAYTLVPADARWKVADGVSVTRPQK